MTPSQDAQAANNLAETAKGWRTWFWRLGLVAILVGYIYYPILAFLLRDWWNDPDSSHGFLVIPFSAFVVYLSRRRWMNLVAAVEVGHRR